jgi:hypothetical protein
MTERPGSGKSGLDESPHNTSDPSPPLPTPPENDRLRDFEPEGDTVRIEFLTDRSKIGPHQG